jgi:GT2 family glycosyltransferase
MSPCDFNIVFSYIDKTNRLMKDLFGGNALENIIIGLASIVLICFTWAVIVIEVVIAEMLLRPLSIFSDKKEKKIDGQKELVSITIVNWNSEGYITDCLSSIIRQKHRDIEVIIVDNNSTDRSLEQIEKYISENNINAKLIKNGKNVGFAKAHNQAIKQAKGQYVLTLNFDVCLSEDFVENMVRGMRSGKKIGISSGKIFNNTEKKGEKVFDTTGAELRNLFCSDRGQGDMDKGQYDKQEYIFGASGCAAFLLREMLEDIRFNEEYFDETFNTYVEDVDLSWRAQIKGWKCLYNPSAIAFHHRGVTRKGQDKATKRIYRNYFIQGFRNRYLMVLKNLPISVFIKKFRFIIWAELKFWANAFLTKRYFYFKFIGGFILLSPCILVKRVHFINTCTTKDAEWLPLLYWGA